MKAEWNHCQRVPWCSLYRTQWSSSHPACSEFQQWTQAELCEQPRKSCPGKHSMPGATQQLCHPHCSLWSHLGKQASFLSLPLKMPASSAFSGMQREEQQKRAGGEEESLAKIIRRGNSRIKGLAVFHSKEKNPFLEMRCTSLCLLKGVAICSKSRM